MIGIYKIENIASKRVYVGQSVNIEKRWQQHKAELRNNYHANKYLQRAWNKYGEKNFSFEILEICKLNELNEKETFWKIHYDKEQGTYNLGATRYKNTMSDEMKKKLSIESLRVWKQKTNEEKNAIIERLRFANKGKSRSKTKEEIEKQRQKMLGRHLSTRTEFKKGHKMSNEIRLKISKTAKGHKVSDETRLKISLANKCHNVSEATRKLISERTKIGMAKAKLKRKEQKDEKLSKVVCDKENDRSTN